MSDGVPITQLHCPTCGEAFRQPLVVEHESSPENLQPLALSRTEMPALARGPYIACRRGHQWSLKTLFRTVDGEPKPDRLLLGAYLGDEAP